MLRETPISSQVHHALFPFGAEGIDPATWTDHVRKNLVPELRHEVHMFYGDALAQTAEARFPGLDYGLPNHRKRLRRFPHHRRLFDVFDELGLTPNEIVRLCDWEGTLWVKRKYEASRGPIRETAGDYIFGGRAARAARARTVQSIVGGGEDGDEDEDVDVDEGADVEAGEAEEEDDMVEIEADDEESQEEHPIVATAQHQSYMTSSARRTGRDTTAPRLTTTATRREVARAAA